MRADPEGRGAGARVVRAVLYCATCRVFIRGAAFPALKRAHKHFDTTGHSVYGSLHCADGIIEQTRIVAGERGSVPDATGFSWGDRTGGKRGD